jgi:hypothetical protein
VVMRRLVGPRKRQRRLIVLAPTVVLALWAGWWVTIKTQERTRELSVDSSVYLSTARSLRASGEPTVAFNLDWDGFTPAQAIRFHGHVPATHFPPGYPAALATTSFVAGSVRGAARALNVVLVAVNILLLGLLTARMTRYRSVVAATLPAVLVLFTDDLRPGFLGTSTFAPRGLGWLTLHLTVASEPLFIALFMGGLLALGPALTDRAPRARRALMVAVGASAAALLVRYIGVALVLAAVVALVALDRRRSLGARVRRAGVFAGVAVAPTVLFAVWGLIRGGGSPRPVFFRPFASSLRLPLEIFATYLFPPGGPIALRLLAVAVVIVLVVVGAIWGPALVGESPDDDHGARVLVLLGTLSIAMYVVVLIITRTSFDFTTPIDPRLLAPVRGVFYAVLVAVAYRALVRFARPLGAVAIIATLTAVAVAGGWSRQELVLRRAATRAPIPNSVDKVVVRLPRDALVVTNLPAAVYAATGHASIALPPTRETLSGKVNPDYDRELRQLAQILDRRGGYLLLVPFFGGVGIPPELHRSLEFRLVERFPHENPFVRLFQIVPKAKPA